MSLSLWRNAPNASAKNAQRLLAQQIAWLPAVLLSGDAKLGQDAKTTLSAYRLAKTIRL
jgi:hypothetical protein